MNTYPTTDKCPHCGDEVADGEVCPCRARDAERNEEFAEMVRQLSHDEIAVLKGVMLALLRGQRRKQGHCLN